jgi:hypothetical protein
MKPLYIHRWRSGLNAVTIQTTFKQYFKNKKQNQSVTRTRQLPNLLQGFTGGMTAPSRLQA